MNEQQRLELIQLKKLYPEQAEEFYQHAKNFGLSIKNHDWWVWECLWNVHIEKTGSTDLDVRILCEVVKK